jgi:hypothetical protein
MLTWPSRQSREWRMNQQLTELVTLIYFEKNQDKKLVLIEEMKELLDAESRRQKSNAAKDSD